MLRVLLLSAALLMVACGDDALVGESCETARCADGLACIDDLCVSPTDTKPEGGCDTIEDCAVAGFSDGRACEEDRCVWSACTSDFACGARVCDDGFCTERDPCFSSADCDDERICDGGACKTPCLVDEECPALGSISIAACNEGVCKQRCFTDGMCLGGGICENNLCVDPACSEDADCVGDNRACDNGRCIQFTPCGSDPDCFDANFRCNDLGRCEERPTCAVDGDCGTSQLCTDQHCRDADVCDDESPCASGKECVVGRCTSAPECRSDDDCSNEVCDGARCVAAPVPGNASALVVDYGFGPCAASGGVCTLVLFEGEVANVDVQGYSATGVPIAAALSVVVSDEQTHIDAAADGHSFDVSHGGDGLLAATEVQATFVSGESEIALQLLWLPTPTAAAAAVVIDGSDGAPIEGATVRFGEAEPVLSDAAGLAHSAAPTGIGVAATHAGRGLLLITPPVGVTRLVLAAPPAATTKAANITIAPTGDEVGPVGFAFALSATAGSELFTPSQVFSFPAAASLSLSQLGALPLSLPGFLQLDVTLPFSGTQTPKAAALVLSDVPFSEALVFETRAEQSSLTSLLLQSTDDIGLAVLRLAESADAARVPLYPLASLPFVADTDDIDGDGDFDELVVDTANASPFAVTAQQKPGVRVGVTVGELPSDSTGAILACGVNGPGVFWPVAVTSLQTPAASGEQLKASVAGAALHQRTRDCVAHALIGEDSAAFVRTRQVGLPARVVPPAFLPPPTEATIVEDVPVMGARSLLFGASAANQLKFEIESSEQSYVVVAPAAAVVTLPTWLGSDVRLLSAARRLLPDAPLAAYTVSSLLVASDDRRSIAASSSRR